MSGGVSQKNGWVQLKGLFLELPPSARLLITFTILAGVILLGGSQLVPQSPDNVYLLGGQELSATRIQSMCRALDAEGLSDYRIEGDRIKVPRERVQQYSTALAKREVLPTGFYAAFDKAAEQTSWLSSSSQDNRRWELAKQKSLAQIIEQMPEVESASVLIDRGQRHGLRSEVEVRATVTIKPRAGGELQPFRVRQIRNLVAGSVAGLPPESVAVVDLHGRALLELGTVASTSEDLLVRMKEFEEHFGWKIRNVLSYLTDVVITVSVELETTRQRRTENVLVLPEETAPAADARETQEGPLVTANAAIELDSVPEAVPAAEPRTTQQTWEEHVALGPKSVTVAIAVPGDVVAAWQASTPAASGWAEQVRQRVASVIPAGIPAQISVESFPRTLEPKAAMEKTKSRSDVNSIPWLLALITCLIVTPALALGGWRWHQSRTRRELASRRAVVDAGSDGRAGTARELVRVERGRTRPQLGPHLIQKTINSFEDLRRLAPSSLQAVLGAVDSGLWAPALRGASRELCDRILTHLPARTAVLLRDEIEFPGPVRLGDVESAQQEILEVVRRLDHTGDLMLEDREEVGRE